jgi:hypothetical protein
METAEIDVNVISEIITIEPSNDRERPTLGTWREGGDSSQLDI